MPRVTRFRRIFGPEPAADVDAELAFHLEMRELELVERGETPARARELALARFGDPDKPRAACVAIGERQRRMLARRHYMSELRHDILLAFRMLRRAPGFAAVAVLTLALGIGATTAIFSVVNGVILRAVPYPDAGRLHAVQMRYPDGTEYTGLSAPDFMSVRENSRVFEQVEAYSPGILTLVGVGDPREVRGAEVTDGLFAMLDLRVAIGRGFLREEHQPGRARVAVLGHGFWRATFGGDPGVVGRTLSLGGEPHTIVGVLADGSALPDETDIYAPIEYGETFSATTATGRRNEYLAVAGRTRPGVSEAQIGEDLDHLGRLLQKDFPETNARLTFTARGLRDLLVGDIQRPLYMLFGAVGLLLLVAAANVANLLLARASARADELAIRAALGAGRGRLVRQLLTESAVVGVAGGTAGLALAYLATRALVAAEPADIPRLTAIGVDATAAWFTLGVALVTSLVFGVLPALHATSLRAPRALAAGARGTDAARGSHRLRAALVVAEIALAVVLLTGAGLLVHSFIEQTRVAPGFDASRALTFRLTLQGDAYRDRDRLRARMREFDDRLSALPGVVDVGAASQLPLTGINTLWGFRVEGAPPPPANVNLEIAVASATPGYFPALGATMVRGRDFTDRDDGEAPRVVVVNEATVRRWFPGTDGLGQRVNFGDGPREVVGVVADMRQGPPGEAVAPMAFLPYPQRPGRTARFVVRTSGDPLALASPVRATIQAIDPDLAVAEMDPLVAIVSRSVARPRFYTAVLSLFAAVGLVLAATGIFGVMSYAVTERTREMSIRMALGARGGQVMRHVMGRTLMLTAAGLGLGLVAALWAGRLVRGLLFGVDAFDPLTVIVVALVLVASATLASLVPARRAAASDPGTLLR
jgi:predicted permease